ncbi:RDD family protein [bacterium]|jgi:uncharacterized RDD family membrane protein YckC|nr:RDD family protein [bacterium]
MNNQIVKNEEDINLIPVKSEKRLVNFLLDIVGFYIFAILFGFCLSIIGLGDLISEQDETFLGYLIVFIYYLFFEFKWQKTPGKWITKSVVVVRDGSKPDFSHILIRTISRFIPFEAFSFIGKNPIGWHDKISKTIVIDDDKRKETLIESSSLFCLKCGEKIDNNSKFCSKCGSNIPSVKINKKRSINKKIIKK